MVHELGQLRGTKELANGGRNRTHVNQRGRGDGLSILGGHALTHNALHTGQTNADLVLDELAHGTQTTVTEVVDIVSVDRDGLTVRCDHLALANVEANQVLEGDSDVFFGEGHETVVVAAQTQLAIDLVAAHLCEVVALCAEEGVVQQD